MHPDSSEPSQALSTPAREEEATLLADICGQVCELAVQEHTVRGALRPISALVMAAVPGADAVSLLVGKATAPDAVASTSSTAAKLDGLQLQRCEGPSLSAAASAAWVVCNDLHTDSRWPGLTAACRATYPDAAPAAIARAVRVSEGQGAVLTLYRLRGQAWTREDLAAAELVAKCVRTVLQVLDQRQRSAALTAQLQDALLSRATIEQAKGIVMAHRGGTPEQAFTVLVDLSSRRNIKLAQLAADMVARLQHRPARAPTRRPGPRPSS